MATSIRLGISQLAWGYDLSRPDGWLRFLDAASEIGYERLLAETDRTYLGAMLDCGHATKDFKGHSALEFLQKHHAIVEYVELKDWSPTTDLKTEVGRGQCDFPAIASLLKEHAYSGWVV